MLPEKWKIKITSENVNIVGEYYNNACKDKHPKICCYTDRTADRYIGSHNCADEFIGDSTIFGSMGASFFYPSEHLPQITTEEFIKHIIKKDQEIHYQIY